MLKLLLTADYEIFGDGSGDVDACMIAPTRAMLDLAEQLGTRVTLFVDVCECWAFEDLNDGEETEGSSPGRAIRSQLREAVARGHDVQLHVHPQWLGARRQSGVDGWLLRMDRWRTGLLPAFEDSGDGITVHTLIQRGVEWLEGLLRPVDSEYRCRAFRAGAWSIQPEGAVLEALAANGIRFDTTVAPGARRDNGLTYFDFTKAPRDKSLWPIAERVDCPAGADALLTEVPIFTRQLEPVEALLWRARRRGGKRPPGCRGQPAAPPQSRGRLGKVWDVIVDPSSRMQLFDFCSLTAREMERLAREAHRRYSAATTHPLVAIGHPKDFGAPNELEAFLSWAVGQDFITLDRLDEPSFWRRS